VWLQSPEVNLLCKWRKGGKKSKPVEIKLKSYEKKRSHEMADWQTFKLFESYLKYLYRTYCGRCVHPAGRALGRAHEPCGHNRDQSLVLASATQYRIVCRIVSNRVESYDSYKAYKPNYAQTELKGQTDPECLCYLCILYCTCVQHSSTLSTLQKVARSEYAANRLAVLLSICLQSNQCSSGLMRGTDNGSKWKSKAWVERQQTNIVLNHSHVILWHNAMLA
jgi:hypothetical protein